VVAHLFPVMMAVAGEKEPPIAGRTAIRVLKQHSVKEPIFEAASSRTEELFATAMGTTRYVNLRSGFVHGEHLCWGFVFYSAMEWCGLKGFAISQFVLELGISLINALPGAAIFGMAAPLDQQHIADLLFVSYALLFRKLAFLPVVANSVIVSAPTVAGSIGTHRLSRYRTNAVPLLHMSGRIGG
jgi:hypothetical protein